jgi:UDP-N-acetylglucosamine 4,6-dehydratase/5-epimerase
MLRNKTFLITGGTGSFGNTLVDKLLSSDISKIVVLSRDEAKQHFMRIKYQDPRLEFRLGDVRDRESVKRALDGVNYVFHAAALKQVPAGESFPWEFVQTNVTGSHNLLTNMGPAGVERAVFLSTDKAVHPINAMGMSKAMMEKLVRSQAYGSKTVPLITRYGNVIGSRGSVIPRFIASILERNIVEITDKSMTRFMMSLSESVDLVLFALKNGASGDLFVQKAPAATVETLVDALGMLLGKKNIQKVIVGIRPGEKIHESLLTAEEHASSTETEKYFQVKARQENESVNQPNHIARGHEYTSSNTQILTSEELAGILREIPEVTSLFK